jgi:hypothetical protein
MDNNTLNFDTDDPQTAFTLRLREASQLRQSAERLVNEGAEMFKEAHERVAGRRSSIVRVINATISRSRLDGVEREMSEELAHRVGVPHDPHDEYPGRSRLPSWSATGDARTRTRKEKGPVPQEKDEEFRARNYSLLLL